MFDYKLHHTIAFIMHTDNSPSGMDFMKCLTFANFNAIW